MAINKQKRLSSSASHFPQSGKTPKAEDAGTKIKNHQEPQNLLFDPKYDKEVTTTHTPIKASVDAEEDLDITDMDEVMPKEAIASEGELYPQDPGVVDTILDDPDSEVDADLSDLDEVDEDEDEDELVSSLEDLDDSNSFEDLEADIDEELDEPVAEGEELVEDLDAGVEDEMMCGSDEGAPLLDVDEVQDDASEDEVAFASIGASLHCIRANRIIATMTRKQALAAGKADVYTHEGFPEVVVASISEKGLRKGLLEAGFKLSTVDLATKAAVKAAVAVKVEAAKAELSAGRKAEGDTMKQALAIASVGINRSFFKDSPNMLRAALEEELTTAYGRGASKIVRAMFAQHGVDYAKSLVALASKIAEMPQGTRDNFVDALDMTASVNGDDDEDDDEDEDDEFDPEDGDDEVPTSVAAALARPAVSNRVVASKLPQKSTAQEILSGAKPLPFL